MALRTSASEVKDIMETGLTDAQILQVAKVANRMVTNILATDSGLDAATLTDIESFLTAHIISIGKDRQAVSEKVKDIWLGFSDNFGKGLEATTYGQMVLMLDSSGLMQQATMKRVKIRAIPQYPENYD